MQDGQAVFYDIHKQFLSHDHVTRQAVERNLLNAHSDSEKKGLNWDKYVSLYKEQHTIMESLAPPWDLSSPEFR